MPIALLLVINTLPFTSYPHTNKYAHIYYQMYINNSFLDLHSNLQSHTYLSI